jgi:hypothetical protein
MDNATREMIDQLQAEINAAVAGVARAEAMLKEYRGVAGAADHWQRWARIYGDRRENAQAQLDELSNPAEGAPR